MQIALAVLQIDLEKAFDQVSHELLLDTLQHVNIGWGVREGLRIAYNGCRIHLAVNKTISKPIQAQRAARRGSPLSPLLFCLYVEALCLTIIRSERINGFRLKSSEVRVLAYADHIAILVFKEREGSLTGAEEVSPASDTACYVRWGMSRVLSRGRIFTQ